MSVWQITKQEYNAIICWNETTGPTAWLARARVLKDKSHKNIKCQHDQTSQSNTTKSIMHHRNKRSDANNMPLRTWARPVFNCQRRVLSPQLSTIRCSKSLQWTLKKYFLPIFHHQSVRSDQSSENLDSLFEDRTAWSRASRHSFWNRLIKALPIFLMPLQLLSERWTMKWRMTWTSAISGCRPRWWRCQNRYESAGRRENPSRAETKIRGSSPLQDQEMLPISLELAEKSDQLNR